ncbi:MAG: flagellar motor protein MotB [Devosia sp.]
MAVSDQPIIIKKIKKGHAAHHGGAWKIAYADFVTAMMAFFLLLWLISMTTDEQKKGLADYFAPASASETASGAGGVMAGTALDTAGAKTSDSVSAKEPGVATASKDVKMTLLAPSDGRQKTIADGMADGKQANAGTKSKFDQAFHSAAASIKQAWQADPEVAQLSDNLIVQETENGLEIQILDQAGRPMFPAGSKFPFEVTRKAIAALGPILNKLPNQIVIDGHTAAGTTYENARYGAWELSSDRANVVRGILGEFGLSDEHVKAVSGRATSEPFFADAPYMAPNERVVITVSYAAPPVPLDLQP